MKAAILCNGINWTIKKNTIYKSRIKVHMKTRKLSRFEI